MNICNFSIQHVIFSSNSSFDREFNSLSNLYKHIYQCLSCFPHKFGFCEILKINQCSHYRKLRLIFNFWTDWPIYKIVFLFDRQFNFNSFLPYKCFSYLAWLLYNFEFYKKIVSAPYTEFHKLFSWTDFQKNKKYRFLQIKFAIKLCIICRDYVKFEKTSYGHSFAGCILRGIPLTRVGRGQFW